MSSWPPPVWVPPLPPVALPVPVRPSHRWVRFFGGLGVVLLLLGIAIGRTDPAPGGWIYDFSRQNAVDLFRLEMNDDADDVLVETLNGQRCDVTGSKSTWLATCPRQSGQRWQVSISNNSSTTFVIWDRGRFWLLTALVVVAIGCIGSFLASGFLLIRARRSELARGTKL